MEPEKTCSKCRKSKSLTEFNPRKNSPDGRTAQCSTCLAASTAWYAADSDTIQAKRKGNSSAKDVRYFKRHGMTMEQARELFKAQDGRCDECDALFTGAVVVYHGKTKVALVCKPCLTLRKIVDKREKALNAPARTWVLPTTPPDVLAGIAADLGIAPIS